MFDLVRSQYSYTDEYIMSKTYTWLKNSVHLISRRTYNNSVFETELLVSQIAGVFGGKHKKLKTFEELQPKKKKPRKMRSTSLDNAMKKYK